MTKTKGTLLGSIAWAVVMLAAAYAFKGHPMGDGVDSVLLIGFVAWLASRSACSPREAGKC